MAVPFSNTKLRVPRGFQNILEGLAREVLRNQPENIFEFGAKYFDTLMEIRQKEGIDPVTEGAKLEDRFYNNKSFQKPDVDPSNPGQQDAALKIQTKYRQHHAEQEVQGMREDQAATKIQAGYRGHQDREKVKTMQEGEEEEEIDIDLDDPEVEKAATKIQAGFKGLKARKEVKALKETQSETAAEEEPPKKAEEEEEIDIDLNDPEVGKAAVKIQAGFKGMKARKDVQTKKEELKAGSTSETSPQLEPTQDEVVPEKEEEEVDIDLNDPDVEAAATKIQAGFKGFKARREVQAKKDALEGNAEPSTEEKTEAPTEENAETVAADNTDKKPEDEEVDIDLTDPDVEKAASKIQAGFKGMKTRKEMKAKKSEATSNETAEEATEETTEEVTETKDSEEKKEEKPEEEEVDIDLTDPEVEKAATKIQAGFKGMKTRKEMKDKKEGETTTEDKPEGETTEEKTED